MTTITIERRFAGPPDSGNGGYCCGRLAAFVEGVARVRLHSPPPLDTPLKVERHGTQVHMTADGSTVATASAAQLSQDVPAPPSAEQARDAATRYRGFEHHCFPRCFVCGPHRDAGDGLRIFAGPVSGRDLVACQWTPGSSLADETGTIRDEFLWAALDCPGAFSFPWPPRDALLLGELSVAIEDKVRPEETLTIIGWEIAAQGRKHLTGTALFGAGDRLIAQGQGTWFEVPLPGEPAAPESP